MKKLRRKRRSLRENNSRRSRRRRRLNERVTARDAEEVADNLYAFTLDVMEGVNEFSDEVVRDYNLEGIANEFWFTFMDYLGETFNKNYGKLDALADIYISYQGNRDVIIDALAETMEDLSE